jgi:hypothetical protein
MYLQYPISDDCTVGCILPSEVAYLCDAPKAGKLPGYRPLTRQFPMRFMILIGHCQIANHMEFGTSKTMIGNMTMSSILTTSIKRNGVRPLKMVLRSTSRTTDRKTKAFKPTGGVM